MASDSVALDEVGVECPHCGFTRGDNTHPADRLFRMFQYYEWCEGIQKFHLKASLGDKWPRKAVGVDRDISDEIDLAMAKCQIQNASRESCIKSTGHYGPCSFDRSVPDVIAPAIDFDEVLSAVNHIGGK